jgi:hypothetical protein
LALTLVKAAPGPTLSDSARFSSTLVARLSMIRRNRMKTELKRVFAWT